MHSVARLIAGSHFVAMCACLELYAPHLIIAMPLRHTQGHITISMIVLSISLVFLMQSDRWRDTDALRSYYIQALSHLFCIAKSCHCFTTMAWTTERPHPSAAVARPLLVLLSSLYMLNTFSLKIQA